MLRFLCGLWFGALLAILAAMYISEKPMRDACGLVGEDYWMVSYNDLVVVCKKGEQRVTVVR